MRKIEQQMMDAIFAGRNWAGSNTMTQANNDGSVDVYLHGHHIANCVGDNERDLKVAVNKRTLFNWATVTTKSRLRAMGVNVYHKKHTLHLDDVPDYKWVM